MTIMLCFMHETLTSQQPPKEKPLKTLWTQRDTYLKKVVCEEQVTEFWILCFVSYTRSFYVALSALELTVYQPGLT